MLFKNILLGKNANTYKGGLGGVLSPGLAQCHDCTMLRPSLGFFISPCCFFPSCVILKQISEIMSFYLDVLILLVSISEKSVCISKR